MRILALLFAFSFLATASSPISAPEKAEYGMEELGTFVTCWQEQKGKVQVTKNLSPNSKPVYATAEGEPLISSTITPPPTSKLYLRHCILLI